jgi:hypothetical protein
VWRLTLARDGIDSGHEEEAEEEEAAKMHALARGRRRRLSNPGLVASKEMGLVWLVWSECVVGPGRDGEAGDTETGGREECVCWLSRCSLLHQLHGYLLRTPILSLPPPSLPPSSLPLFLAFSFSFSLSLSLSIVCVSVTYKICKWRVWEQVQVVRA